MVNVIVFDPLPAREWRVRVRGCYITDAIVIDLNVGRPLRTFDQSMCFDCPASDGDVYYVTRILRELNFGIDSVPLRIPRRGGNVDEHPFGAHYFVRQPYEESPRFCAVGYDLLQPELISKLPDLQNYPCVLCSQLLNSNYTAVAVEFGGREILAQSVILPHLYLRPREPVGVWYFDHLPPLEHFMPPMP